MVNLEKQAVAVTGAVNLEKGAPPMLIKRARHLTAEASWSSQTDYDVYAIILLANGETKHVAAFPAAGIPASMGYANLVRHRGDVGRSAVYGGGVATEIVDIALDDNIRAVVPCVYSAQSNGNGSFKKYRVSLAVDDLNGTRVEITADNGSRNPLVYTCVPAIIHNTAEGAIIERVELYSGWGNENRPLVQLDADGNVQVIMNKGPRNQYK